MKNLLLMLVVCLCVSCASTDSVGEEFMFSGKVYKDCNKDFVYKNTPLEVVLKNQGLGGGKNDVLATATTDANGYFSLKFNIKRPDEVALQIPANDAIQLYSPITVKEFNSERIREEVKTLLDYDFFVAPRTNVKVRLKCGKVYTNQDTLYLNEPFGGTVVHKIIAPASDVYVTFQKGDPHFGSVVFSYGIGWQEYEKARISGYNGRPDYNLLRFRYPECDKSPIEIVLNLP
jgi:hypothetical protein